MQTHRDIDPLDLSDAERARVERALADARLADLRPRAVIEPLVAVSACLVALVVLTLRRLGELPIERSLQGGLSIVLWSGAFFGLALAIQAAWRAHRLRKLPQGKAVTRGELVLLEGSMLRVIGLEHLEAVEVSTVPLQHAIPSPTVDFDAPELAGVELRFDDGTVARFHVHAHQRGPVVADLEAASAALEHAYAENERATLERMQLFPDLDPAPGGEGPFRVAPARASFNPPSPRRRHLAVASAVALLGPGAWWGRNALSDELAYRHAARVDSVATWLAYAPPRPHDADEPLFAPRHRDEVLQVRLPRARLRQARRYGVEGLQSFIRLHGDSPVAEEARRELDAHAPSR
ncbi:MAG: hypothetical protein KF901_21620 [Myxococcales bacterium]|nr:hypothetical protein [Myxococcales bacterium]